MRVYSDKDALGIAARYYTVLITTGEDGYESRRPEELDSSQSHHVGEEMRTVTHEDGNDYSRTFEYPP